MPAEQITPDDLADVRSEDIDADTVAVVWHLSETMSPHRQEEIYEAAKVLATRVTVAVLPPGVLMEQLDEAEMAALGWVPAS